jgi:hypothetical protein
VALRGDDENEDHHGDEERLGQSNVCEHGASRVNEWNRHDQRHLD